jgi:hypothetical protein
MKEELEQKSINLLNWLEQTIKTTTDFGAEQIPLFIQELLRYNYWMSLSQFIVGIVGALLSLFAAYKFVKWSLKKDIDALPFSMFFLFSIGGFISFSYHNLDWIMIQLAPRLYLMEYVKEMIKH